MIYKVGTPSNRFTIFFQSCGGLESICARGAKDLRKTDGGYFGAGPYVALQSEYAAGYATRTWNLPVMGVQQGRVADQEYAMVLCLVGVGNVYPGTRKADYVESGKSVFQFELVFDAHGKPVWELDSSGQPLLDVDGKRVQKRKDQALKAGFDAHVITVSQRTAWLATDLRQDMDFASQDPAQLADEIVLKDEVQVLPVAVVYVRPAAPAL
jgi:hypothetical protein